MKYSSHSVIFIFPCTFLLLSYLFILLFLFWWCSGACGRFFCIPADQSSRFSGVSLQKAGTTGTFITSGFKVLSLTHLSVTHSPAIIFIFSIWCRLLNSCYSLKFSNVKLCCTSVHMLIFQYMSSAVRYLLEQFCSFF